MKYISKIQKLSTATEQEEVDILYDEACRLENIRYNQISSWVKYQSLYDNRTLLNSFSYMNINSNDQILSSMNGIRICIDSLASMISLNRPMPKQSSRGSSYDVIRNIYLANILMFDKFVSEKVWQKATMAARNAAIFGIGFIMLAEKYKTFCIKNVHPVNVLFDTRCGSWDDLDVLCHRRVVPYCEIEKKFKHVKRDMHSQYGGWGGISGYYNIPEDFCVLCELWCKSTGYKYTFVRNHLLEKKKFSGCFPFVPIYIMEPVDGIIGHSVVRELAELQRFLNLTNIAIRRINAIGSIPRMMVPHGSSIDPEELASGSAIVYKYKGGTPPTWMQNLVNTYSGLYNLPDMIVGRMMQIAGVGMSFATAQRPEGIESAAGIRELTTREGSRHAFTTMRMEESFEEIAKIALKIMKENNKKSSVNVSFSDGHPSIEQEVNWSLIDVDRTDIVIQSSSLSSMGPAARMEVVNSWLSSGAITAQDAAYLIDHPDLNAFAEKEFSERKLIEQFCFVLSSPAMKRPVPDTHMPLDVLFTGVSRAYAAAVADNFEEEILERFRLFLNETFLLMEETQEELRQMKMLSEQMGQENERNPEAQ